LKYLNRQRVLLVFDNLETLLEDRVDTGYFRAGYEGYGRLLHRLAESEHQSCLLLTSREKPSDLIPYEGNLCPVRALRLSGLERAACEQFFEELGVAGSNYDQEQLVRWYGGNPLALKIVARTIVELFGGEIAPFLSQGEVVFGGVRTLLVKQFERLSPEEQSILLWLAILREPVTLDELLAVQSFPWPRAQVLEALEALRRRSLIEPGHLPGTFTLQSVVLEYAIAKLIDDAAREIEQGILVRLIEHDLEQATVRGYIRQVNERLMVAPILERLHSAYPEPQALEEQLIRLLDQLRKQSTITEGYGPKNILRLLLALRGDLRGLDLSHLLIRGADLQGVEMQDANLSGATLRDTSFTGTFNFITTIATSPDGRYWAAANQMGELRVWLAGDQTLYRVQQAHTERDYTITFSPDSHTLATGGWDGLAKVWDVEQGTLLWTGSHPAAVQRVVFSPDGRTLASAGNDEVIRFWDAKQGTLIRMLSTPGGPIFALAWHPGGRLLASAGSDHQIRLWDMQAEQPGETVGLLPGHTSWVIKMAFSPDGRILASSGFDRSVRLWDVDNLRLSDTLFGHTGIVLGLAWCPDGNLLASCGDDQTIRLWDVEQASPRAVIHGHHGSVMDIAFTSDGRYLVSGGLDNTLRVWETERGQCMRILQSYTASINDLAWSPDGARLASIGADTLVTIWDVTEAMPLKVFRGLSWVLNAVAWSPDGRLLAISGWVNVIRIWDASTGTCLQTLRDPDHVDTPLHGIGWSPDGKYLAAGSTGRGMQVWDAATGAQVWVNPMQQIDNLHVIWSPDGRRLASSGTENNVYLWDAANGTMLAKLQGHQGLVKDIAWSPDGARLASCGGTGSAELLVWDAKNGTCLSNWREPGAAISAVAWDPSGTILVCGSDDGRLHWRSAESGETIRVQEGYPGPVSLMKLSPDGQTLASSGDDGAIDLWGFESGEKLQTLRRDRPYERMNISDVQGLSEAQVATLRVLGAIEKP
jgi:WD40 repeat protein